MRRAEARVDLGAIERNAVRLARELTDGAALCAVGQGRRLRPRRRARRPRRPGRRPTWLAVATADEAAELRAEGIDARLLVMGALTGDELDIALEATRTSSPGAWRGCATRSATATRACTSSSTPAWAGSAPRDGDEADAVCAVAGPRLAGLMSHFATADEREDAFFGEQLERFRAWALPHKHGRPDLVPAHRQQRGDAARRRQPLRPGPLRHRRLRYDPFHEDAAARELEPALELRSYVPTSSRSRPAMSAGYGRRFIASGRPASPRCRSATATACAGG